MALDFGRAFREARIKAGLTQQSLSDLIGLSCQQISAVELGDRSPFPDDCIRRACEVMGIDPEPLRHLAIQARKARNKEIQTRSAHNKQLLQEIAATKINTEVRRMPIDMASAMCKTRGVVIETRPHSGVCPECGEAWTSDSKRKELCGRRECEKKRDRKMYAARVEKKKLAKQRAELKAKAAQNASA